MKRLAEKDVITQHDGPISRQYPKHATIFGLVKASQDFFDGKNIYTAPTVRIFSVDLIPFIGTNMLIVKSEAMGSEKTSKRWSQVIQFFDMHYSDTPQKGYLEGIDAKTREKFYFLPLQQKVNRVDCFCSCPDFAWRFSYFVDSRFKALVGQVLGEIKGYKRKTPPPPEGRPFVNPSSMPGMCKHLIQLVTTMAKNKAII